MIAGRFLSRLVCLLAAASAAGWMFQIVHPAGLTWAGLAVPGAVAPEGEQRDPGEQGEVARLPSGAVTHRLVEARWRDEGPPGAAPAAPVGAALAPVALAGLAEIDWAEAMRRVEEGRAILVDVRSRPAFDAGHVPGAVSAPVDEMAAGEWGALEPGKVGDLDLVLYCSNARCPQARQAARLLEPRFGAGRLAQVPGGYFEWRMENAKQEGGRQ